MAPLTLMLKMTGSSNLVLRELKTDEVVGGGSRADKTVMDSFKLSKSRKIVKKSEKPQKPEKLQRLLVQRNVHQSTDSWLI